MAKLGKNYPLIPMRDFFHVPDNYFLSHSVGALPKTTRSALSDDFFSHWQSGENWSQWMPLLDEFRAGVASLLSVNPGGICPQSNVSSALTKILYSLTENKARKTILLSKQDFPTIGFVFKQAERQGYNIKFVEGDPALISNWEKSWQDDVGIVHVTHALSNTSHLLPVAKICALAQSKNVISIIDIAQSLGAVPVDVTAWQADFVIGTGVKFLCFGPGACFLYASQNMLETCKPIDVGWFSHENPFEMDIEAFRFAADAMRFFGGTPSPAPIATANNALKLWKTIGLETVYSKIQTSLSHLFANLGERHIVSPADPTARGATFVWHCQNRDGLRKALERQNIKCDERAEGFRFSVHGYTSESELDCLLNTLSDKAL